MVRLNEDKLTGRILNEFRALTGSMFRDEAVMLFVREEAVVTFNSLKKNFE